MNGIQLKERGCAKVTENTPEQWRNEALSVVAAMAASGLSFHAEDVRGLVGDPPNHPNAFGAIFNTASKAKLIVRIGDVLAKRNNAHARRISLYKGARFA